MQAKNDPATIQVSEGMPATIAYYTDRHAATVASVELWKSGPRAGTVRAIIVREDTATRTDSNGMSDCQRYTFEANPSGNVHRFTWKDGCWRARGTRLAVGFRDHFHDYGS